jgi:cobalt-zinc-cadmium resistance protein CzcA
MIGGWICWKTVGNVFEGEKRFDMVVWIKSERDINDLKNLYVTTQRGTDSVTGISF